VLEPFLAVASRGRCCRWALWAPAVGASLRPLTHVCVCVLLYVSCCFISAVVAAEEAALDGRVADCPQVDTALRREEAAATRMERLGGGHGAQSRKEVNLTLRRTC
jgi:hypothetical protein